MVAAYHQARGINVCHLNSVKKLSGVIENFVTEKPNNILSKKQDDASALLIVIPLLFFLYLRKVDDFFPFSSLTFKYLVTENLRTVLPIARPLLRNW